MRLFFWITFIYALVAIALTFLLRDDAGVALHNLLASMLNLRSHVSTGSWVLLALFGLAWWKSPTNQDFVDRLGRTVLGLALCGVFMASFSSVKSLLPLMADALDIPRFFADPTFAQLDAGLHFGTDPWVYAHAATQALGIEDFIHRSTIVYSLIWVPPALYLPAFLLLFGAPRAQFSHFVSLYALAWIGLGNIAALAGLSAGPVFYDRIFGTERFTDLTMVLDTAGLQYSWYGGVQDLLWTSYTEMAQTAGSGISAFPSLHVAMMTVVALYLAGFGWIGKAVGVALVGAVLFVSVWIGYHYAIDGYASIAAVLVAHWALRRRSEDARAGDAIPAMTPGE